jgi:hypothetical protein
LAKNSSIGFYAMALALGKPNVLFVRLAFFQLAPNGSARMFGI